MQILGENKEQQTVSCSSDLERGMIVIRGRNNDRNWEVLFLRLQCCLHFLWWKYINVPLELLIKAEDSACTLL